MPPQPPPTFALPPSPPHPLLTILEITLAIAALCFILVFVIWFIPQQHNREMWKGIQLKRLRRRGRSTGGVPSSDFRDGLAFEEDEDLWILGGEEERSVWERREGEEEGEGAVGKGSGDGDGEGTYGIEEV